MTDVPMAGWQKKTVAAIIGLLICTISLVAISVTALIRNQQHLQQEIVLINTERLRNCP